MVLCEEPCHFSRLYRCHSRRSTTTTAAAAAAGEVGRRRGRRVGVQQCRVNRPRWKRVGVAVAPEILRDGPRTHARPCRAARIARGRPGGLRRQRRRARRGEETSSRPRHGCRVSAWPASRWRHSQVRDGVARVRSNSRSGAFSSEVALEAHDYASCLDVAVRSLHRRDHSCHGIGAPAAAACRVGHARERNWHGVVQ